MRQNKRDNGVMKSRSSSNDAMVRPNKRGEFVSYPVLYAMKTETKQAR